MSISIYSIKQNLADLNGFKDQLPKEVKDAIERVTDDCNEVLEIFDSIQSNIKE